MAGSENIGRRPPGIWLYVSVLTVEAIAAIAYLVGVEPSVLRIDYVKGALYMAPAAGLWYLLPVLLYAGLLVLLVSRPRPRSTRIIVAVSALAILLAGLIAVGTRVGPEFSYPDVTLMLIVPCTAVALYALTARQRSMLTVFGLAVYALAMGAIAASALLVAAAWAG